MELDFDVVDLPETDHVAEGEQAPDFERPLVTDEYWEDVALSDLTEAGPVVLLFHTMDGAFPTTYVWQEVSDRGWPDAEDFEVVGLSISTPYEHTDFVDAKDLDARLFSDPQNGVAETYGIAHDLDGMTGISEPRPAAFVVDEERVVQYAWVAEEWPDFPDYDELEAAIDDVV
ncbi:MAG: peroxiredoxin family protein [Haloarculaceae archaeon]